MGKNEFLTPKAIANRIKAKGLQKLRWYCQMCQKQCRDENGFKCHCMSESHQRQMEVFGQNPHRIVDGYSEEFESTFLDHMKRSHRFSRIAATVVYNEYINDRHHVHMNSTKWATLTEFVKYLGKTGKCKVDETPKGWFITYIDRDSETIFKERLKNKRAKADIVDEEKQEREIKRQIERAEQLGLGNVGDKSVESEDKKLLLLRADDGGEKKIKLSIGSVKNAGKEKGEGSSIFIFDEVDNVNKVGNGKKEKSGGGSVLDELIKEEEKAKERMNRKDYWLCEGIVVKVMSKVLADKGYYKQKGVVRKVIDKYVGEIEMLESKHKLRVDQEELETVIPQIGGLVRVVNGAYRGSNARLLSVNTDKFCAKVQIEKGVYDGRVIQAIEYEDICKVVHIVAFEIRTDAAWIMFWGLHSLSVMSIMDMKVLSLFEEETPQIFTLCGRDPRSSLRILRPGLAISEMAVSQLPGVPSAVWTVKRNVNDEFDAFVVVSFANATLLLSIGETVEEVSDSGFLDSTRSLAVSLIGDDSLMQVHPSGIRHIREDGRGNEWRTP
ncbi:putative KIN17-like protein [Helianthus annuus]|nr:putative KIN17-like protein [Helianthus annuus]KAJ0555112.1 putative KIN17-like protein [Helianthus annuus]KAJ0720679.1 putative KIN17-like protein [Helianthus annuus]KAJ0723861.1 putative KIN17-like protein [Helianthus annuus]KAJ0899750.1 putative KIN17-like protein [Helianthus annuus]